MEAFMIVGSRARLLARRDMLESFHSMRFPAELRPGLTSPREVAGGAGPMFVVASGYLAGRPSSYLARATDGGVCLANVVGSGPATGPCPAIQAAGSIEVLRTGPWAAVIGVVSRRARSVQAELAAGETVAGEIVRPPPLLHAPFNFYSIELPLQSRGDVVAFDGAGGTLGRRSFDPPSLPVLKRGGVPGQRWVLLDREQANGVRCIDFDAGHGDHATFCPDAVPASRDLQATLMTTPSGRRIVVGVASARVAYVRVGFLTPKYVPCRLLPFPRAFHGPGAVLPPMYNLFVGSLASIDGAVIEGYDRRWNPVDGMPLGTGGGFGT
jgi:hypothetical protein